MRPANRKYICLFLLFFVVHTNTHSFPSLARKLQTVVGYDNFSCMETVRDQALGVHARFQRHMTNAILVENPHLPETGLRQTMLNTSQKLDYCMLERSPNLLRDAKWEAASLYFISEAVRSVHHSAVTCIFKEDPSKLPSFPAVRRLDYSKKCHVHQLGAIFQNEGTIEGTYGVHNAIWLDQLGYSAESEKADFSTRLWLVWGDQKTAELIRSVKREQGMTASEAYDRRDWILGPQAYFHILQSLTYMVVRTHWSSPTGASFAHNLMHDIAIWKRLGIDRNNVKYHLIEPLLISSFNSRILALVYAEMDSQGLLRGRIRDLEQTELIEHRMSLYCEVLSELTPEQYRKVLCGVRKKVFTYPAWRGDNDHKGEFTTLCRFLQEMELFLLFKKAVKFGDVGWVRRLVDPLIVLFYGSDQHRYGYEMIHLRWLLTPGVADPVLQDAILASGLINIRGKPDTFKAIDLMIEHINCTYKLDMRNFRNSTHDVMSTFDIIALTSNFNLQLRAAVESAFGERTKNSHTTRSTVRDVFAMAMMLWKGGHCMLPSGHANARQVLHVVPRSPDILTIGSELRYEKVAEFNSNVTTREGTAVSAEVTDPGSIPADEAAVHDLAAYAEETEHGFNVDSDMSAGECSENEI